MARASRDFQVFVKPAGAACNLGCAYCYYLERSDLSPRARPCRMPEDILEAYIVQHIEAWADEEIRFSWHGGEPTVLGLDYFRTITRLQRAHGSPGRRITNGIQTNGTLLDEAWCRFLAEEGFAVGLSLDGPQELHDRYRVTRNGEPTFERAVRGYRLLQEHGIPCEILCVVSDGNVRHPREVYRYFKELGVSHVTFLPLVERQPAVERGVSDRTVPPAAFGDFLCTVFDLWSAEDIGQVFVQIFEEAVRPAFGQEHTLCIFKEVCGAVPVVEANGDVYSCDHFVDEAHRVGNIRATPLVELLESPVQHAFGNAKLETLPRSCRSCEVKAMCNGGCPKNRFAQAPDGEPGLNYLCAGYRRFFTHCRPFVDQVAALWRYQQMFQPGTGA
jgi:uncharacterized protein